MRVPSASDNVPLHASPVAVFEAAQANDYITG
jgi:hypothetical protein